MSPDEIEAALKLARKAMRSQSPNTVKVGKELERLAKHIKNLPHVAKGNYAQGAVVTCVEQDPERAR